MIYELPKLQEKNISISLDLPILPNLEYGLPLLGINQDHLTRKAERMRR